MKTTNITAAAATKLTLQHPFWMEIFYSMTPNASDRSDGVPTAATDGRLLFVNEEWYGKLSLDEQVGVVAHELAHKIFLHPYRRNGRDPRIWNYACDYAINALLHENSFTLPTPHLYEEKYKGMSAETIYQDLIKNPPPKSKGKGQGSGEGSGNGEPDMDDMMDLRDPVDGMSPEQIAREEAEIKALVERAVANARAYGKLPAGIDAGLTEAYKASKESWYNHLHRYMQSLSASAYNWSHLNRRTLRSHGYFSPMLKDDSLGVVRVYIDTSGSCYDKAMQSNFCGHLNAILASCRPEKVIVSYFDTQVYEGEEISPGELDICTRPKGGGGTSFEPIFDDIENSGEIPDVAIILTDLEGSFPAIEPAYNVVWATIGNNEAPFGVTVQIEV